MPFEGPHEEPSIVRLSEVRADRSEQAPFRVSGYEGELMLVFQPKVEAERLVGIEALVRDVAYADGAPKELFESAEANGTEHQLNMTILTEVCKQVQAWQKAGIYTPVSVNIGAADLTNGFVKELEDILQRTDTPGSAIELEINETTEPDPRFAPILAEVKALGVRVSLDDFGSANANNELLAALQHVDMVKIDRRLAESGEAYDLARTLQAQGYEVVIEGVPEDMLDLVPPGCAVQSFAMSPPLNAKDFEAFYTERESLTVPDQKRVA